MDDSRADDASTDVGSDHRQRGAILLATVVGLASFLLFAISPLWWLSSTCVPSFLSPSFLGLLTAAGVLAHIGLCAVLFGAIVRAFSRAVSWRDVGLLAVIVSVLTVVGLCSGELARYWTVQRMEEYTSRLQPAVEAIQHFRRDHGSSPKSLAELVPDYLADEPQTGMCSEHFELEYDGTYSRWSLQIHLWNDGIEPVYVLYRSDLRYEDEWYFAQRIGDWGLIHER